ELMFLSSTGVFTVNITDLREEDSGIYWCGAHVITKVHLNVALDETIDLLHIWVSELLWRFIPNVLFFANLSVLSFCLFVCVVILGNPI
uniref:Immunoglobulin V-set domain-containing protein n=1 Tax=Sinocyclocheilus rhinocerous TaxID=307959 RepID=A0A673M8R6_9TELE